MTQEKDLRLSAKEIALRWLDRREYSSHEVQRRLIQKGIPSEIASNVVSELSDLGLISDERFAKSLTRDQAIRGKGPHVIRQKLRAKGICLDLAATKKLTEEMTQKSELDAAREFVDRRFPSLKEKPKDKKEAHRALQALIRRGFSYSVALAAIGQA